MSTSEHFSSLSPSPFWWQLDILSCRCPGWSPFTKSLAAKHANIKYPSAQLQSGHTSICFQLYHHVLSSLQSLQQFKSYVPVAIKITKTPFRVIHLVKTDVENVSAWIQCYWWASRLWSVIVGRLRWLSWPSSCPSQCWHQLYVSRLDQFGFGGWSKIFLCFILQIEEL